MIIINSGSVVKRHSAITFSLPLLAAAAVLLLTPKVAVSSVDEALRLCVRVILPSVFPFSVIGNLLLAYDFESICGGFIGRPAAALTGCGKVGAAAFLVGAICGYQAGADYVLGMRDKGIISADEAERLFCICSVCGPAFTVGGIGSGMLGNIAAGWIIYLSQLAASLLCGFVWRCLRPIKHVTATLSVPSEKSFGGFGQALYKGTITALSACGAVIFFTVSSEAIVSLLPGNYGIFNIIISSIGELSGGAAALSVSMSVKAATVACSAAVGWSGFSSLGQTAAINRGRLSMSRYAAFRAFSAPVSAVISAIMIFFFDFFGFF